MAEEDTTIDLTHQKINNAATLEIPSNTTHLILRRNQIRQLTANVFTPALVHLDVYDNGLAELPDLNDTNISYLDASFNRINTVGSLPNSLESLFCASNRLGEIPKGLPPQLKILECGANQINSVDTSTFPKSLRELYLAANHIATFIPSMMPNLHILALQFNELKAIPHDICTLFPELQELYLGNNLIDVLPNEWPAQLRILELSHNRLQSLTLTIPSLEEIWAESNQIRDVAQVDVVKCTALKVLYLDGNPLPSAFRLALKVPKTCVTTK